MIFIYTVPRKPTQEKPTVTVATAAKSTVTHSRKVNYFLQSLCKLLLFTPHTALQNQIDPEYRG